MDHELTLKAATLTPGFVAADEFDRVVDPADTVQPYVATGRSQRPAKAAMQARLIVTELTHCDA